MEVNNQSGEIKDGVEAAAIAFLPAAPPSGERTNGSARTGNRKRRRGKHKRKIMKSFARPRVWNTERRRDERRLRVRPKPLNETGAPYNNNQFLMEIHAPNQESRTRDSSFSVDSEENYLCSLPEDEEDYLTKEFSSVYEDAARERLAALSKTELLQEYRALEARYESVSRSEEAELRRRLREREQQLRELQAENEKLRQQVERLQRASSSSSADSESDSTSSLSSASSPAPPDQALVNGHADSNFAQLNGHASPSTTPIYNGFQRHDEDL